MLGPNVRYHSFVADSARWDGFELRDGDIIISTPPKCGTTWMQMLVASLVRPEGLDRPLTRISPWLEMMTAPLAEVRADLESQTHRRLIKSHTPMDGLPDDDRIRYVCVARDPRDVAFSWDNHHANMDHDLFVQSRVAATGIEDLAELGPPSPPPPDDPTERFWRWVDEEPPPSEGVSGLVATLHHLSTFWARRDDPRVALFHYGRLTQDLPGEVRRLAAFLGIEVDDERVGEIVAGASFAAMKADASALAPGAPDGHWRSDSRFFDQGPKRRWADVLDAADVRRYEARLADLDYDAEFLGWVHGP